MNERWHGTENGYACHGCSCPACREAHRLYMAGWRARAAQREPLRHDNSSYQNYGCRCETCTAAATANRRRQRALPQAAAS